MDTLYLTRPAGLTTKLRTAPLGDDSSLSELVTRKRDRMEPTCLIDPVRPLAKHLYKRVIALLGGFFPALRAARLPVATALRED